MRVLLVAEQLRRAAPGGIGTYVSALATGLRKLAAEGVDVQLWASRPPRRPDPLAALAPVHTAPLPGPLLVWAWDRGLLGPP
jgi:hypothetical protein